MELSFDSGRLIYDTNELREQVLNILGQRGKYVNSIAKEIMRRNGFGLKAASRSKFTHHEFHSLTKRISMELSYLTETGLVRKEKRQKGYIYRRKVP